MDEKVDFTNEDTNQENFIAILRMVFSKNI